MSLRNHLLVKKGRKIFREMRKKMNIEANHAQPVARVVYLPEPFKDWARGAFRLARRSAR